MDKFCSGNVTDQNYCIKKKHRNKEEVSLKTMNQIKRNYQLENGCFETGTLITKPVCSRLCVQ